MIYALNTLFFPNINLIHEKKKKKSTFQGPDEIHLQEALPNVPDQK